MEEHKINEVLRRELKQAELGRGIPNSSL